MTQAVPEKHIVIFFVLYFHTVIFFLNLLFAINNLRRLTLDFNDTNPS